MKAHVYVTLKTSVLDPQGQTIQNALRKIGFADVTAVRQGKYFALSLADGLSADAAKAEVERIAREVLTNPVIEEFTYRIEEQSAVLRGDVPVASVALSRRPSCAA
jgi:phosphoribosylformylglycinamidine synthase PurS subunit